MTWRDIVKAAQARDDGLDARLEACLEPHLKGTGLGRAFYLPLFHYLADRAAGSARRPFVAGLNAPQGAGKSTLTAHLVKLFEWTGRRAVAISIDDFYLTRAEQRWLARDNPGNAYLQQRGYPGTHDIALGVEVLSRLTAPAGEDFIDLPRYDKSRHEGRGDRADRASWPRVPLPVDVVLFEGWMLGFRPVPAGTVGDPALRRINALLRAYEKWHAFLDGLVYLQPRDPLYVVGWRSEAEERMKAAGRSGMPAEAARAYAELFLPAYRLYGPHLAEQPPVRRDAFLKLIIDRDRRPVSD